MVTLDRIYRCDQMKTIPCPISSNSPSFPPLKTSKPQSSNRCKRSWRLSIRLKVPQLEAKIDRLAYVLYNLTADEIALVEEKR